MEDQRVIKERYYNKIMKKDCGRDKWLEGKREEVSSLENEIKRIRSNKDKTKKISHFGLGERESKNGQERREEKGRRRRKRRRKEEKRRKKEKKREDHRYGTMIWYRKVWNCEYLYEYTCL